MANIIITGRQRVVRKNDEVIRNIMADDRELRNEIETHV